MCRLKLKVVIDTLASKIYSFNKLFEELKEWFSINPLENISKLYKVNYDSLLTNRDFWESMTASKYLLKTFMAPSWFNKTKFKKLNNINFENNKVDLSVH